MNDELPFAPARQRPLSLFNPFDYLVLLYWVFYFPQALRWYVQRFGTAPASVGIRDILRQDRVQRHQWPRSLIQGASPLPIPGLEARLSERLQADWLEGLRSSEGLLRYSLQFIAVTTAIGKVLAATEAPRLLPRIAAWCDLGPYDWKAIRYQSASLRSALAAGFWDGVFLLPRRWRPRIVDELRYDTPARAACAGFWHLHQGEAGLAEQAFALVESLAFGAELHANAAALASALRCDAFEQIGDWQPPEPDDRELLRPQVADVLERLGEVARDARLVRHSRSIRERSSALNLASGALKALQGDLAACPQPEQVVVEQVVNRWLERVLGVASEVGALVARAPVASPYIVGAPVPADRLVGREGVFEQIRSAWDKPGQRDSLVIYGHRRMGKTSVLRNVLAFCPFCHFDADSGLAYLNLQTVDWSEPLADLCHAIAFALWQTAPQTRDEPDAATFQKQPLAALRRFLAGLDGGPSGRRCILVLDEYELLDEHLPADHATRFVMLLRGLTQQYPWLVVALVGLHALIG